MFGMSDREKMLNHAREQARADTVRQKMQAEIDLEYRKESARAERDVEYINRGGIFYSIKILIFWIYRIIAWCVFIAVICMLAAIPVIGWIGLAALLAARFRIAKKVAVGLPASLVAPRHVSDANSWELTGLERLMRKLVP